MVYSHIFIKDTPSKFSSILSSNILIKTWDDDKVMHYFSYLCTSALDKVAPQKSRMKGSKNPPPWITDAENLKEHARE